MTEVSEIRRADDTYLVIARFPCDDIPLQVCDNLADAEALAVVVANEPELILRDMAESWKAMGNEKPDVQWLASVIVLRLLGGVVPIELMVSAVPQEDE